MKAGDHRNYSEIQNRLWPAGLMFFLSTFSVFFIMLYFCQDVMIVFGAFNQIFFLGV